MAPRLGPEPRSRLRPQIPGPTPLGRRADSTSEGPGGVGGAVETGGLKGQEPVLAPSPIAPQGASQKVPAQWGLSCVTGPKSRWGFRAMLTPGAATAPPPHLAQVELRLDHSGGNRERGKRPPLGMCPGNPCRASAPPGRRARGAGHLQPQSSASGGDPEALSRVAAAVPGDRCPGASPGPRGSVWAAGGVRARCLTRARLSVFRHT